MQPSVILVSGANRGIGRAIVESLASRKESLIVYAASRKGEDIGVASTSSVQVKPVKLDVSNAQSRDELFKSIESLDVLINNAGAQSIGQKQTNEVYMNVLDVNYYSTLQMCQAAIPKLREGGRIVNMSSVGCKLENYSKPNQDRFRKAYDGMTLDELEELVQEYETSFKKGTTKEDGWPFQKPYCVSKAAVTAFTAILARENPKFQINCCCPGWVNTEMGSLIGNPSKTPAQGAMIPVRLAMADIGDVTGQYWEEASVSSVGNGHVSSW